MFPGIQKRRCLSCVLPGLKSGCPLLIPQDNSTQVAMQYSLLTFATALISHCIHRFSYFLKPQAEFSLTKESWDSLPTEDHLRKTTACLTHAQHFFLTRVQESYGTECHTFTPMQICVL